MRLSQQHQAPIAAQSRPGHCRPLLVCCSASSGGEQQSGPSRATRRALSRRALSLRQQSANTQEANEDLAHDRRRRSWAARRFQEPPSSIAKEEDTEQEQSESSSTSQLLEAQRQLLKRIFQSRPEAWLDAPIAADVAIARPPSAPSAQKQCLQLEELPEKDTEEICSVEHPGTICCTSTTVTRDPAAMDVTLHLTTSVRLSNPHSPTSTSNVTLSDLEQLGCMAAVQHLHQQATQLAARNGSTTVQDRHEAVLRVLSQGHVVSAEKQTNQFGHVTFKVELEHPDTHEKMHAFVKPCVEDHGGGWHRAEVEAVAYRLNRLLGMDYVPPCAYRKQMDVDWTHFEHGGIFMYWAEGGEELRCTPMEQWPVPSEVVLSDARVLDVLLQNSDRHHGHFLMAEHWAQGGGARSPADPGWKGAMMPVFIDHAAGFRSEAFVHMKHQNAFNTGETARISARTFLRLRCLDRLAVSQALGDVLSPAEVDQVMRRREDILSYLDALVASRGYDKVVVEDHGPAWCSAPPSVPVQHHTQQQQQQHGHHHH